MGKKQLKISCNFHANEDNYLDQIVKLENIIKTIKDRFDIKCICMARVVNKHIHVYILPYDKVLYETLDYNSDYFSCNNENILIEVDYLTNIEKKVDESYYYNALDIIWYKDTEIFHILENVVSADTVDHKITREYPHEDMNDFFTNGDITEDEDDEIPFD